MHEKPHKWAGQTRKYKLAGKGSPQIPSTGECWVEDWADRLWKQSWGLMNGNPTAMIYGMRSGFAGLPTDDEVVYVKIAEKSKDGSTYHLAHLLHKSEIL